MERNRTLSRGCTTISEPVGDLTDFMNDMFLGAADMDKKTYNLTGGSSSVMVEDEDSTTTQSHGFDDSVRSRSGRLTQEWLEEARQIVAASPSPCESPARRFSASPRFVASQPSSPLPSFERDLLSRSARRYSHRGAESLSGEILSKSAIHSSTKSHSFVPPPSLSPSSPLHKFFTISDILQSTPTIDNTSSSSSDTPPSTLPSRPSLPRTSRFQTQTSLPPHSRRTFRTPTPSPDAPSPDNVTQAAPRRSLSKSNSLPLSPPRNIVESAHRRSISSSTCSLEKIVSRPYANGLPKNGEGTQSHSLKGFLKEQRMLIQKILNGELNTKAKLVLSGPSNSTTSMVAAISYAWLLGYRQRESDDGKEHVVVPVMNVKRGSMWKLRQAAWLFDHAGLDPTSLLFADEVDMESLRMTGQVSILVVGEDILSNTGEVGSQCTVLTDNYCEDAYDLLQNPVLKKLLLAGILLDTQNLKASALFSITRDSEAVQLLLVGSPPNYRYALYDQIMQDQNATSFVEALHHNYGKNPDENDQNGEGNMEPRVRERKSNSTSDHEVIVPSPNKKSTDTESAKANMVSPKSAKLTSPPSQALTPAPAPAEKEPSGGKNKFFLFKWFGFGSK